MNIRKDDNSPYLYYHNGRPCFEGRLPEDSHLGVGVYESMRVRKLNLSAGILGLDMHLERLKRGAEFIGSRAFNLQKLRSNITLAIKRFDWESTTDALLRIVQYRHDDFLSLTSWKPTFDVNVGAALWPVGGLRAHPEYKSCSALTSVMARQTAYEHGAGEALLVDLEGIVKEGAWSNFFWVDGPGTVRTPRTGLLPGITRAIVIWLAGREGSQVLEEDCSLETIMAEASEAFITQATHGLVGVVALGEHPIRFGEHASITTRLRKRYESLFHADEKTFFSEFSIGD